MTARTGIEGFQPKVEQGSGNPEAVKYGAMWARPEYRKISPGEQLAAAFIQTAKPRAGAHVVDFGCGTGRGGKALATLGELRVTLVDFVRNCLDDDVRAMVEAGQLGFVKADLEVGPLPVAEYGFCCDVMEHIPPDKVERVLDNVLRAARHVFFSISTVEDSCGALIGEPLHLTVQPYSWWAERFAARGAKVAWSVEVPGAALFYLSAWATAEDINEVMVLNTAEEEIRAQVRHNVAQGWQQVIPHEPSDAEVLILGGGPSLAAFEAEIRERKAAGAKIVTLNGAYTWALEHGLGPVTTVIVDAREFNKRFVQPIREDCLYLIASRCHPAVLEGLPKSRTYLWHDTGDLIEDILKEAYPPTLGLVPGTEDQATILPGYWPVPGGSSVLLRAIPLLRMLGYSRFHLYGCDSCLTGDAHHAFAQPENDSAPVIPICVTLDGHLGPIEPGREGRIFACHPWMVAQASEMVDLIRSPIGEHIELEIHGDGLLAYILELAAAAASAEAKNRAPVRPDRRHVCLCGKADLGPMFVTNSPRCESVIDYICERLEHRVPAGAGTFRPTPSGGRSVQPRWQYGQASATAVTGR